MFESFKTKLAKRIEKLLYLAMPCGTVITGLFVEPPDGYIAYFARKVYEVEHKRLYDTLYLNNNLVKGSDSKGNYVELNNPDERAIQITTNPSLVGKLLAAALPNITGIIYDLASTLDEGVMGHGQGAFISGPTTKNSGITKASQLTKTGDTGDGIDFNASANNALYNGNKLQPSALQVLACIRT